MLVNRSAHNLLFKVKDQNQYAKKMFNRPIFKWNLKREPVSSADGSTTRESIQEQIGTLEKRQKDLPVLITTLTHSLAVQKQDFEWIKDLKGLKQRKWEKEKSTTKEQAIRDYANRITANTAKLSSMKSELSRIPAQIETLQKQVSTLVQGESKGLEKGLDSETARELGELELQKERERMAHEKQVREAAQKREAQADAEQAAKDKAANNKKWLWIGALLLLLVILGIWYKKRKSAMKAETT